MQPSTLLIATLLISFCAPGCKREAPPPEPTAPPAPANVIIVSVDTLRADFLGCYGFAEHDVSPRIDALAKEGILFESFISSSPWTLPAHMSLFTSLGPSSHGMNASFNEIIGSYQEGRRFFRLPEARTTLAELLAEKGFATAAFTGGGPMDPRLGFGQGFERYDQEMFKLSEHNMGQMLGWVKAHAKKRFFLFWHHFEVHAPYLHAGLIDKVLDAETSEKVADGLEQIAVLPESDLWPAGAVDLRDQELAVLREHGAYRPRACAALYAGAVAAADRWFGRLREALVEAGVYDRTMIVLMSDHGEEFADHKPRHFYNMHGHTLYEEMIRVPLIVKLPGGRRAGTRVKGVARMVDVMPTVLDVLGFRPAKNEMQGESLRPLWEKPRRAKRRVAYSEALTTDREAKSARTAEHKLIVSAGAEWVAAHGRASLPDEPDRLELYDLATDPKEKKNLVGAAGVPGVEARVKELEGKLRAYLPEVPGAPETTPLDDDTLERLKSLGYIQK